MFHKTIIAGYIGRDPEVRYSNDGKPVATISVGASESWRDRDGNKKEETTWYRCVAFGKTAEVIEKHCTKGKPVLIEGRIKTSQWEKDGETRHGWDLRIDRLQFLPSGGGQRGQDRPQGRAQSGGQGDPGDPNNDIPF